MVAATESASPRKSAWSEALALLARRDLSEGEVRKRLEERGREAGEIDQTVAKLRERRYLDDRGLAQSLAARRAEDRLHGPALLRHYLRRRLLPADLIDEAIREAFPDGAEESRASRVLEKMNARPGSARPSDEGMDDRAARRELRRVRERQLRRLLSRGFSFEAARRAVDESTRASGEVES